jgi:hypothetical protein
VKRLSTALMALALVTVFGGCSHHEADDDDNNGHILRVDKATGVVTTIDKDRIVRVKTPEEQAAEDSVRDQLVKPKDFSTLSLSKFGGGAAHLRIFWRDDNIYYRFSVVGDAKQVEAASTEAEPPFKIQLRSADGTIVKRIDVPGKSMARTKNDQVVPLIEFAVASSDPCPEDDYRRIVSWNIAGPMSKP